MGKPTSHQLHWQCEECGLKGSAGRRRNPDADSDISSILDQHLSLNIRRGTVCGANYMALMDRGRGQQHILFLIPGQKEFTIGPYPKGREGRPGVSRIRRGIPWRCEVCNLGGMARGTVNTGADKALNSILRHHHLLGEKAGIKCVANFLAIPAGDHPDYWLFMMKESASTNMTIGTEDTNNA